MTEPLPKQELLIKLMGMTTSDSDNEALAAMRRANSLLANAGWDWAKLIHGKITVVEDPFKSLGDPGRPTYQPERRPPPTVHRPPPPSPPTPKPGPYDSDTHGWGPVFGNPGQAPSTPPPPRMGQPSSTIIKGVSVNRFPGFCWCCAKEVIAGNGFIFKPRAHNPRGPDKFMVICTPCEAQRTMCLDQPAIATGKRRRSVGDLA